MAWRDLASLIPAVEKIDLVAQGGASAGLMNALLEGDYPRLCEVVFEAISVGRCTGIDAARLMKLCAVRPNLRVLLGRCEVREDVRVSCGSTLTSKSQQGCADIWSGELRTVCPAYNRW